MKTLLKLIQADNNSVYDKINTQIPALYEENKLEYIKNIVVPNLKVIEEEIDALFFSKIKSSKNIEEAEVYFDILQQIQGILAELFFKGKIELSDILRRFISDCERLDDEWLRNHLFGLIKEGKYNYDFMRKW